MKELMSVSGYDTLKNEVLLNACLTATSEKKQKKSGKVPLDYSLKFYQWKKKFEIRKNWQVYKKATCPRCATKITMQYSGKIKRLSFFCGNCQLLFEKN